MKETEKFTGGNAHNFLPVIIFVLIFFFKVVAL